MKRVYLSFVFLVLATAAHSQISVPQNVRAASAPEFRMLEPLGSEPAGPLATTTVAMKYHDITLPRFNWQMPRDYGSFMNLFMLQRFTLPNSSGFLDSIQVFITSMTPGSISFRVYPAQQLSVGNATFWFPEFTPAIDSLFIPSTAITQNAWNTIKFNGNIVPKEFFVSAEFTITGGTNNTIVLAGDFHDLPSRSLDRTRVIMLNTAAGSLDMRTLDSTLVESGTQKPIYSYLYMTAFADTATSNIMPKIITTAMTKGYVGLEYQYNLHAAANPRPAYRIIAGPQSMTIGHNTGEIRWTPGPTEKGNHTVTIEAFNTNGADQQTYTLVVADPTAPKITSFPKRVAIAGEPYFYQTTATGGPEPTFTVQASLTGITIDPITGQVRLTPTAQQIGEHIVGISAKNAVGSDVQSFTLKIEATASGPKITTQARTTVTVNQSYNYQVAATGNPQPTFSLPTAPPGMTIDMNSGVISWLPTQVGDFDVKVRAENRVGIDEQIFKVAVASGASLPVFNFTPRTMAVADVQFIDTVLATSTPAPRYFLKTAPSGMRMDSVKGIITWSPTRDNKGSNAVNVEARNEAGSVEFPYSVFVQTAPRITSSEIFTASIGIEYKYQVTAEGEPAPTFALPTAPTGMIINASSGLITWTPIASQLGRHTVTVSATNTIGKAEQTFTIDVNDPTSVGGSIEQNGFTLSSVYPNPAQAASGEAFVDYDVPASSQVRIELSDAAGRLVAVIADARVEAGMHSTAINVASLPAGMYLVSLRSGSARLTRAFTLVR